MSETQKTPEVEIPLEKLPHLQLTEKSMGVLKELVVALNNRKALITEILGDNDASYEASSESKYKRNEYQILLIKTDFELARVHSNIVQKKMYFDDYMANIKSVLAEMEVKWDSLMEKAKTKKHNADIVKLLEEANLEAFENNLEIKVNHYLQIKTRVYPKPNEPQSMRPVK